VLSDIETRRENSAVAQALRRQAHKIVEFIAAHIGQPELHASFLNLPDVLSVVRDE